MDYGNVHAWKINKEQLPTITRAHQKEDVLGAKQAHSMTSILINLKKQI